MFRSVPVSSIVVLPERQRKEFGDLAGLAESIRQHGLLQPLTILPDGERNILIAGERRFRAIQSLSWTEVPVNERADLSDADREVLELEENIRRLDLSWPERIAAISRLATSFGLSQKEAATKVQVPEATLSKMITLAEAMKVNPKLRLAGSWTGAYTAHLDQQKKQSDAAFENILSDAGSVSIEVTTEGEVALAAPAVVVPTPDAPEPLPELPSNRFTECRSFLDWAPTYEGKRFNLIHCDFPYGLNMDSANLQNSAARWDVTDGRYDDSPELFENLCETFFEQQDRFVAESAHCIFWLAHKNFGKYWSRFKYFGWTPCEVPLIWHKSDSKGIAPDPRRQPRRTYEIAIFASRGDRKIVKVKDASFSSPTTKLHHLSEKPLPVVTHFLEMLTDGTTEILDPTCGSGTALEAALRLGACRARGLDVLPQHVEHTEKRCGLVERDDPLRGLEIDLDLSE